MQNGNIFSFKKLSDRILEREKTIVMSRTRSVPMVLSPTCFDVKKNSAGSQSLYRRLTSSSTEAVMLCALCIVHCAVCTVYCALCSVHCALWSLQCALCSVHCAMCTMHRALCNVSVKWALGNVHCATPLVPWERARLCCTTKYVWARNFSWRSGPGVFLLNRYSSRNPCRPSLPCRKIWQQVCGSSPSESKG